MTFSAIEKSNHSHMVLLDTPLHVDTVTYESKLPWPKYLKRQQSKNSHPSIPPASLSAALDIMKVVTELRARPSIIVNLKNTLLPQMLYYSKPSI
jgi:hypothetical protein